MGADIADLEYVNHSHEEPHAASKWIERAKAQPFAALVLATMVVAFAKNGLGIYPSSALQSMQAIARHWTDPTRSSLFAPSNNYFLSSPTSAIVAGILHLSGARAFLWFHFALSLFVIALPISMPKVRRDRELRLLVASLTAGGAFASVLLSWLGSYDPVSLGAATVGALAESPIVAGFAWGVFAFNNTPEAILALVVFGLVCVAARGWAALSRVGISAAGTVAGYFGIRLLTSSWGGSTSRVTMFGHWPFSDFVNSAVDFWPLILYSCLGIGWFLLFEREVWKSRATKALFFGTVTVGVGIPLIALDQSRVASGILWPALLYVTVFVFSTLSWNARQRVLQRVLLSALVVPMVLVWNNSQVFAGWHSALNVFRYIS